MLEVLHELAKVNPRQPGPCRFRPRMYAEIGEAKRASPMRAGIRPLTDTVGRTGALDTLTVGEPPVHERVANDRTTYERFAGTARLLKSTERPATPWDKYHQPFQKQGHYSAGTRMTQLGKNQISEAETKTIFLHGLFPRTEGHGRLFSYVGLAKPPRGYRERSAAASSLREKGLLDKHDRLTPKGWASLSELVTPSILDASIRFWENTLRSAREERDRHASAWGRLGDYLPRLHPEPERRVPTIHAPETVKKLCEDYLTQARLCLMVGAWAGAVQYCSLAIEHTLAQVLRIRKPETPYDRIDTLGKLIQKVAGMVKGLDSAARKLADQISIFRNGSVHPRDVDQRPGESEARAVYDMTLRFLTHVRQDWFVAPVPAQSD